MQKLLRAVKPFVMGFSLAFIIFNLTMCPDKATGPSDTNNTGNETAELKSFVSKAENVFLEGNRDSVLAITYENYAELLKDDLPNDPEKIKKFGEALQKRKLVYAGPMYAEYEVTINGETYTVAFGQSGDGVWKIVRF